MFWTSITDGIGTLFTHWEIWVSILIYGLIFLTYFILFGLAMSAGEDKGGVQMAGCLTHMITGTALQGMLVAFMVTSILPILCGGHDFIPLSFLADNWWAITKTGLISIGITLLLSLIPVVGHFISNTPGTSIFVQGVIVFQMLANKVLSEVLDNLNSNADIFPGFWTSVGFLILSIVIVYLVSFGLIILLTSLKIINKNAMVTMGFVISVLPGVLCLCIYCSYVRLTILHIAPSVAT
jgi:hypothetical protein